MRMGKIKLGIVDDNKDFCEVLQKLFLPAK